MQRIPVQAFTFNKETQTLSTDASDIQNLLDMDRVLHYESIQVIGVRETKLYAFYDVVRERARNEIGDIQAWKLRPVDRFGRRVDGPEMVIFND